MYYKIHMDLMLNDSNLDFNDPQQPKFQLPIVSQISHSRFDERAEEREWIEKNITDLQLTSAIEYCNVLQKILNNDKQLGVEGFFFFFGWNFATIVAIFYRKIYNEKPDVDAYLWFIFSLFILLLYENNGLFSLN